MKKNSRAFTLIELILASAMMVLLFAGAYSIFHTGTLSWNAIDARQQTALEWRAVAERLNRDIRNCVAFGEKDARFSGTADGLSFFTVVDSWSAGTTLSDLGLVSYVFREGKLLRSCLTGTAALKAPGGADYDEFSRTMAGFSFSYGEYNASSGGWEWKDTWEDPARLPSCVSVKASFAGREPASFERAIYLPAGGTL